MFRNRSDLCKQEISQLQESWLIYYSVVTEKIYLITGGAVAIVLELKFGDP